VIDMNETSERPREHVRSLLAEFETAMLVTRCPNGELRSRPMIIADLEGDAELWFVTSVASGKIGEIAEQAQVNVALSSPRAFVSISGVASVVGDHRLRAKLWKESFRVWFPEGKDDPEITLIRVVPETVEYWDLQGKHGLRQAWEAARALIRREKPEPAPGAHGTVQIS
jgi:general stress protein 26